jgi:hypothetical protein
MSTSKESLKISKKTESLNEELSAEEEFFATQLLLLTGREDRLEQSKLERKPLVMPAQLAGIRAVIPILRDSTQRGIDNIGQCDLLNRLLLSLGVKPATPEFFDVVFGGLDFSKEDDVEERVEKFRQLCMLEYGSFRYGYKVLKSGKDTGRHQTLQELWSKYFPSAAEVSEEVKKYKTKPGPVGLIDIPPGQLFGLGYLASEQAKKINGARKKLLAVLETAIGGGVENEADLINVAKKLGLDNFGAFVATAGIPGIEKLLYPKLWAPSTSYQNVMRDVKDNCFIVDEDAIKTAQEMGKQNTMTYFAMHDIDVYMATSMRDPLHFTTNQAFVTELFKRGDLKDWGLRYFDPTQSYLPDRIQKGLTECLMIKRAAVSVYNAQESDTFGKDAEAAVALAQGKPVIVYVARLFSEDTRFKDFYRLADSAPRREKESLVEELITASIITKTEANSLLAPEKTKNDCIAFAAERLDSRLKTVEPGEVQAELIRHGYEPPNSQDELVPFTVRRISALERRALTFRDVHPLSLQASPMDGVPRGVIVTRSVQETAKVLQGLLVGNLEYQIVEQKDNWLLLDTITRSPVRVVAKSEILTTAFWSEFSSSAED